MTRNRDVTAHLDKIADHLECRGLLKEAHDLDIVSNTIEAGVANWIRGAISKIPGLPSKEDALRILSPLAEKDPSKFSKVVEQARNILQGVGAGGQAFTGREAFDLRGIARGIRTFTDPKMLMAALSLMGMFQTADAGELRDKIRQMNIEWRAELKQKAEAERQQWELGKQERKERKVREQELEEQEESRELGESLEESQRSFQSSFSIPIAKDTLYAKVKGWVQSNMRSPHIVSEGSNPEMRTFKAKSEMTLPITGFEKAFVGSPTKIRFSMDATIRDGGGQFTFSDFRQSPSYTEEGQMVEEGPLVTRGIGSVSRERLEKELSNLSTRVQRDLSSESAQKPQQ